MKNGHISVKFAHTKKKEILQSQNFVDYRDKYEFNLNKSIELNISIGK